MSTRSRIGMIMEDGTVHSVYCHCDGYPSYNGRILKEYYNTSEKVKELISLGDISSLGKTTKFREEYDEECTRDYHRWRGEPINILVNSDVYDYAYHGYECGEEYIYLFDGKRWMVQGSPCWQSLDDLLIDDTL